MVANAVYIFKIWENYWRANSKPSIWLVVANIKKWLARFNDRGYCNRSYSINLNKDLLPISIIVAIKNGEKNIIRLLDGLSNQQYKGLMEFLIVDDVKWYKCLGASNAAHWAPNSFLSGACKLGTAITKIPAGVSNRLICLNKSWMLWICSSECHKVITSKYLFFDK